MSDIYILGLHTSHDASACLIRNGTILCAIEKERLSRIKHDNGKAGLNIVVDYCLNYAGISLSDISYIVVNDIDDITESTVLSENEIRISHHLAHAWAGVALSPFDECAVLVVDGEGSSVSMMQHEEKMICHQNSSDVSSEKESSYIYRGGKLEAIRKVVSDRGWNGAFSGTDGTGSPYWFLSQLIFGKEFQEAKIMGLSSYGETDNRFSDIFQLLPDGIIKIDTNWTQQFKNEMFNNWNKYSCLYKNIAATVQNQLECAIIHMAKWLRNVSQVDNLVFCGGTALNCVANGRLANSKIFSRTFVPPAAGDSSISVGCAYYGWHVLYGATQKMEGQKPYWGKRYNGSDIDGALSPYLDKGLVTIQRNWNISDISNYLSNGEIIAWFQGESEFGPRALGNRSILADPRSSTVKDTLNKKIKHREGFRPFAPSVPSEYVADWFEETTELLFYMQFIAKVKAKVVSEVPAITHIDGTARVHLVRKQDNPLFHELLTEFNKQTRCPILLNTSFNIHEPIVESPADAIKTFVSSGIDRLVINNILVTRNAFISTNESAKTNSEKYMIWHKPVKLAKELGSAKHFLLMPHTMAFSKERWNSAISSRNVRSKKVNISQALYKSLYRINPRVGDVLSISELISRLSVELTREWDEVLFSSRVASLVIKKHVK